MRKRKGKGEFRYKVVQGKMKNEHKNERERGYKRFRSDKEGEREVREITKEREWRGGGKGNKGMIEMWNEERNETNIIGG